MQLKQTIHRFLEESPTSMGPRFVQLGIMIIILVNVTAVVVETVEDPFMAGEPRVSLGVSHKLFFNRLEWISVALFTVEYLLRMWSVTVDPRFARPVLGRLRFAVTPMALVDLLAILPSYFLATGFVAARALRLLRIFRIFKLARYSIALKSLTRAFMTKRAELWITIFVIGILLVLSSTVLYYAERDAQPDKFSSIPAAMWWGIITLTTVGYGDISPVTPLGKFVGGLVALFGIGLVALPAGILGSAFIQEFSAQKKPERCPHCGKEIC